MDLFEILNFMSENSNELPNKTGYVHTHMRLKYTHCQQKVQQSTYCAFAPCVRIWLHDSTLFFIGVIYYYYEGLSLKFHKDLFNVSKLMFELPKKGTFVL